MKSKKIKIIICFVSIIIVALVIWQTIYMKYFYTVDGRFLPPEPLDKGVIDNIKKEYPKWMEKLEIPDKKIIGYEGTCGYSYEEINKRNQISMNIDDSEGDYLNDLVQKDNDFLREYPGLFNKGEKRMLYYAYHNGSWPCVRSYGYKNYLESACENLNIDVTLNRNMKIGFVLENIKRGKPTLDNIEVLEIYRDKKSMSSTDGEGMSVNSSFLLEHKINDLKYIILLDFAEGTDKKLEEEIKSTYPDVKIYQVNTKDEEKQ